MDEFVQQLRTYIIQHDFQLGATLQGKVAPSIFDHLKEMFVKFIKTNGDDINSEFLIPTVINYLLQTQREKVFALNSNSNWFGITHKEDSPFVGFQMQKIVDNGEYPKVLF